MSRCGVMLIAGAVGAEWVPRGSVLLLLLAAVRLRKREEQHEVVKPRDDLAALALALSLALFRSGRGGWLRPDRHGHCGGGCEGEDEDSVAEMHLENEY